MEELTWDRTILESFSLSGSSEGTTSALSTSTTATPPDQLSAVAIWNYLIRLSKAEPDTTTNSKSTKPKSRHGPLRHYTASDFAQGWEASPQRLGGGASYTVEKWTLDDKSLAKNEGSKKAGQSDTSSVVAIKRLNIPKDGFAPEHLVTTVLKELRILTHPPLLKHRSIARLLGFRSEFANPGNLANHTVDISLVAEFAPFGTLQDFPFDDSRYQKREDDDDDDAPSGPLYTKAGFVYDIASGLEALHACGIAHGDVKVENTLIFSGGDRRAYVAKLSDFGHSILDLDKEGTAASRRYLGTPILNAPEVRFPGQVRFRTANDFYRCDIFSYGILVWEVILSGKRFYTALGADIAKTDDNDDGDQRVVKLSSLPKDDLLIAARASLRDEHRDQEHKALVRMLSNVLQGVLRDDPAERRPIEEVLDIFRKQKVFRDEDNLDTIFIEEATEQQLLSSHTIEHLEPLPGMPDYVQKDLVTQLQASLETATSPSVRRSILYDLAMCAFAGVGVQDDCVTEALSWLSEAAQLQSIPALAIVFRLYHAFQKEIPHELALISHPIKDFEDGFADFLPSIHYSPYYIERVRRFEQLFQVEALSQPYNILNHGKIVATSINLDEVEDTLSKLGGLDPRILECVPCQATEGKYAPPVNGLLIYVAARLGLSSLVRFLLSLPISSFTTKIVDILPSTKDGNLLTAACRGGHYELLEFLVCEGSDAAHDLSQQVGTALHWLIMFPEDKIEAALLLLLGTLSGPECLQVEVLAPGVPLDLHHCVLTGTPLEFALTVNHAPLVELLLDRLDLDEKDVASDDLDQIGWTINTFRFAIASRMSRQMARLVTLDEAYRHDQVQLDRSRGRPIIKAIGLFHLAQDIPSPVKVLLIHGNQARAELDTSIWGLSHGEAIVAHNDVDEHGSSVLTCAIRLAPCHLNTDLISLLLQFTAEFAPQETPKSVTTKVLSQRSSRDAYLITTLLLEYGLIPHTLAFLPVAVSGGNSGILTAMLDFTASGKRLDASAPYVDGNDSVSLLFYALTVPRCAAILRILLNYGADPASVLPKEFKTPLEVLIDQPECDTEAIDLLIDRGAPLVLRDGHTILHHAAIKGGEVRGVHVMVHLLRNPRICALVNDESPLEVIIPMAAITLGDLEPMQPMPPLKMACLAGQPVAVQALLQTSFNMRHTGISEEIGFKNRNTLLEALSFARRVGRHPQKSPLFDQQKLQDVDAKYRWRLKIEQIMLLLLNIADPGHGRTQLHIASELGNFRRVEYLIEQRGHKVYVTDRHNRTPLTYLEDVNKPDNDLDSLETRLAEKYVANVGFLKHFLTERLVEELCADMDNLDALRGYLSNPSIYMTGEDESQKIKLELETHLRLLDLDREAVTMGDGYSSPAELIEKFSTLLELRKKTLGDSNIQTLRTMRKLAESYCRVNRFDEAKKIYIPALDGIQAQLSPSEEELFRTYADYAGILCCQGEYNLSLQYIQPLVTEARNRLGSRHVITLGLLDMCNMLSSQLGNLEEASKQMEASLSIYYSIKEANRSIEDNADLFVAIYDLKTNLMQNYCKLGKFDAARKLVGEPGMCREALRLAKTGKFYYVFCNLLYGMAATMDLYKQDDVAEQMYEEIVGACIRRHKKRKSYCTRTALEKLAGFYLRHREFGKQSDTLQQLVDVLASSLGSEHPETIRAMKNLAFTLTAQSMWDEAGMLQERVIRSLGKEDPVDNDLLIETKLNFSRTLTQLHQSERAIDFARDAVLSLRTIYGNEDEKTTNGEMQLCTNLLVLGGEARLAEAATLRQRHVDLSLKKHGEMSEKTRNAIDSLVAVLLMQDNLSEAETKARWCLRVCEGVPETDHRSLARAYLHLAIALQSDLADKRSEQQASYERSIAIEKQGNGGNHSSTSLMTLKSLAKSHMIAKEYDQAIPMLRELIAKSAEAYAGDKDTQLVLDAMTFLGYIAKDTEDHEDAISHYKDAAALSRRLHGDSAQETARLLNNLVLIYNKMGRYDMDSFEAALEVLRYRRETFGEYHEQTRDIKIGISGICIELEMWPDVERIDRDLLRQHQFILKDEEETALYKRTISTSCQKQGFSRHQDALNLAREALSFWKTKGDEKEVVYCIIRLGEILADAKGDMEKLSEAEKLALGGNTKVKSLAEDYESEELQVDLNALLGQVYYEQGRLEEAEELQVPLISRREDSDEEVYIDELKHIRALFATYVAMGRYQEAIALGQNTLDKAKRVLSNEDEDEEEDENSYLYDMKPLWWIMVDQIDVLGKHLGQWRDARAMGKILLKWIYKSDGKDDFEGRKALRAAIIAIRHVCEKLGVTSMVLEFDMAMKKEEALQKTRIQQHLAKLKEDELKFEEYMRAQKGA